MPKYPFAIVTIAVVAAQGCATAARTPQPNVAPPPSFVSAEATTTDAVEQQWWRQFSDPVLDDLIERAFAANRDVQAAASRYAAAQSLAGEARLRQWPTGGLAVRAGRQHLSEVEALGLDLPARTFTSLAVGTQFQWEADVFGRIRGAARAAVHAADASEADARDVQVAVVAQVASAYFDLRGAEREVLLLSEVDGRTTELVRLTRSLVEGGRLTRVDLLRAEQIEQEIEIAVLAAAQVRETARNRLATLLGVVPEGFTVPSAPLEPLALRALAVGAPADLLRRRPDIVGAEARVAQAAAEAGVSRADLFPQVGVTGTLGLVAGTVGNLATAGAGSWFLGPQLVWNLLDVPRLRRRLAASRAITDAVLAEYEGTVLRALEETETALSDYRTATATFEAQARRSAAAQAAAKLVAVQFREGFVDSLTRVLAERDALTAAIAENRALVDHRQAVTAVYRALGGGWRPVAASRTPPLPSGRRP